MSGPGGATDKAMPDRDKLKQAAAEAAMAFLPASGIIGLGTGTTARRAIQLVAARLAQEGPGLIGVERSLLAEGIGETCNS